MLLNLEQKLSFTNYCISLYDFLWLYYYGYSWFLYDVSYHDCIMQLKKSYHNATNVCSRKSAATFGDLPDWLAVYQSCVFSSVSYFLTRFLWLLDWQKFAFLTCVSIEPSELSHSIVEPSQSGMYSDLTDEHAADNRQRQRYYPFGQIGMMRANALWNCSLTHGHQGPLYKQRLTLVLAWIGNCIQFDVWDEILICSQSSTVQP